MSSFQGKLITLTGLDRCGKATQQGLLIAAMRQSGLPVQGLSFPEYADGSGKGHWAAEFVRATLNEEALTVQREHGAPLTFHPQKQPYIFQMWHAADRLDRADWIERTLKTSHLVCDRYSVDAMAYGLVDGCAPEWLAAMSALYWPTDLTVILVGRPCPRPGEAADLNERDAGFQARVRAAYERLSREHPQSAALLCVDPLRSADALRSKGRVHRWVCGQIRERLALPVAPLKTAEIAEIEARVSAERAGG